MAEMVIFAKLGVHSIFDGTECLVFVPRTLVGLAARLSELLFVINHFSYYALVRAYCQFFQHMD